jgi:hypothetical protein
MPKGKPRKAPARAPKAIEVVETEPEEIEPPQPKVVEVKHKTEWSEMRPVEEAPEALSLFEEDDIEPAKPRRRPQSEAEDIRKKLARAGITPSSSLKLTIEKYAHSEVVDGQGGMFAEKEHCTKYVCSEEHVKSEDYLDVARRFGPGLYRFTLRMKNQIVTAWDKRISASSAPAMHANPADPNSPQVIFQMPEGMNNAQQPVGVIDPMKQMRDLAKTYKELKSAFEPEAANLQQQAAPTDPKVAALQLIAENPDVMERIGKGIASTVLGHKGAGDSDPWADVAMEAVKSGQAVEIVRAAIDSIFSGINGLFPKGNQNGQAPMGAPRVAPMANQNNGRAQAPPQVLPDEERHGPQRLGNDPSPVTQASTEDQALALVIEHCRRNAPVKVAFNRLINLADAIEEQAPAGSIYDYVELFGKMDTDAALTFVEGLPGGRQVVALPHCKEWTAELQRMIRESERGDDA